MLLTLWFLAFGAGEGIHGTFVCDLDALREMTLKQMRKTLGELSQKQVDLVTSEVAKVDIRLVLQKNGIVRYAVDLGDDRKRDGMGRWRLEDSKLILVITHKYGLRLERPQRLTGNVTDGVISMQLAEGLPMLSLIPKQDPPVKP